MKQGIAVRFMQEFGEDRQGPIPKRSLSVFSMGGVFEIG